MSEILSFFLLHQIDRLSFLSRHPAKYCLMRLRSPDLWRAKRSVCDVRQSVLSEDSLGFGVVLSFRSSSPSQPSLDSGRFIGLALDQMMISKSPNCEATGSIFSNYHVSARGVNTHESRIWNFA